LIRYQALENDLGLEEQSAGRHNNRKQVVAVVKEKISNRDIPGVHVNNFPCV
jgi:hypothetical protein